MRLVRAVSSAGSSESVSLALDFPTSATTLILIMLVHSIAKRCNLQCSKATKNIPRHLFGDTSRGDCAIMLSCHRRLPFQLKMLCQSSILGSQETVPSSLTSITERPP